MECNHIFNVLDAKIALSFFFNSLCKGIFEILLLQTPQNVNFLVIYKNIQEIPLIWKLTHWILNTFCQTTFLEPEGSIRFFTIQKLELFLSETLFAAITLLNQKGTVLTIHSCLP